MLYCKQRTGLPPQYSNARRDQRGQYLEGVQTNRIEFVKCIYIKSDGCMFRVSVSKRHGVLEYRPRGYHQQFAVVKMFDKYFIQIID